MRHLRSSNKNPRGDSTFVLNTVRFCYMDDLEKITKKSVKGRSNDKEPISPERLSRFESMYKEHLGDMTLEEEERNIREKKFVRHVHKAIMNITAGLKKTSQNKKIICISEE